MFGKGERHGSTFSSAKVGGSRDQIMLKFYELNIESLKRTVGLLSLFLLIYFTSSLILSGLSVFLTKEIDWSSTVSIIICAVTVGLDILGIITAISGIRAYAVMDSNRSLICSKMFIVLSGAVICYLVFYYSLHFKALSEHFFNDYGLGLVACTFYILFNIIFAALACTYFVLKSVRLNQFITEFLQLNPYSGGSYKNRISFLDR